jgi:hypothetical protein
VGDVRKKPYVVIAAALTTLLITALTNVVSASAVSLAAPGEAKSAGAPGTPGSLQGGASGSFMCASSASEVVDLSSSAVSMATSYVIEQASTANGTYAVARPAPVFSGNSATITDTTAVTEYYEVEALIGSAWTSSLAGSALNGSITPGFVVLSTSAPECTNN